MDKCSSDAEFDSYWDYEAKNKNRNRIRVGRQYQATVTHLLKPGEKDGRKSEDLETLKWRPDQLSDQEVEQYLSMAKGVGLFAKSVDNSRVSDKPENNLQSAIKGLSEFVASHHPCHHDDGCQIPKPSCSGESSKVTTTKDWSPSEAQLFAQALESCGKNFCAIKKEYLPWKPVRSIIEYYYQGKGEKFKNSTENLANLDEEKEEKPEPVACCSHSEHIKVEATDTESKPVVELKKELEPTKELCSENKFGSTKELEPSEELDPSTKIESAKEQEPVKELESTKEQESISEQDQGTTKETNVFLECTESSKDSIPKSEVRVPGSDDSTVLSTVGSLKFFLGGRLVLKLNAQQDHGSGGSTTKCQWVQSNDLPKHAGGTRKVKHKKKNIQEGSITVSSAESPKHSKKKGGESPFSSSTRNSPLECNDAASVAVKKLKLNSEYDFAAAEVPSQGALLCSSYWTPPVADGQESVEMDDGSSKTSEGYTSPVLPNSRYAKADVRTVELVGHPDLSHDSAEQKPESRASSIQSEGSCYAAEDRNNPCGEVESGSHYPAEVLNHKSALSHSRLLVKSPCYLPQANRSISPLVKQWGKLPFSERAKTSSSSSHSPLSVVDSKSPVKDIPLDLTCSNSSEIPPEQCDSCSPHRAPLKTTVKVERPDNVTPSKSDALHELSPMSSKCGSHCDSNGHHKKMFENESTCQGVKSEEPRLDDVAQTENCECSPCKKPSLDEGQLSYSYSNLPFHCELPTKCTKDYSLEEHLCNKNDSGKNKDSNEEYILQEVDDDLCKKNPAWCSKSMASYLQFYPQCYPYYLTYGMTSSPVTEAVVTEVPLDLSSANENVKEKTAGPDTLPEEVAVSSHTQNNSDAVERGMLYQLLKNKTSK